MKRILGKGKAKGTVLFTVITVMLVMVVLLMTTLTLTSAAQRRSYYTYFESQAQYAAQAAIDAISYGAYQDDSFHDFVLGAPLAEDVTDTNPAPEIQVRFDGSSIPFTGNNPVVRCTIERLPEDAKWDEATSALHPREMWRITATAHVGNGRNEATYSISQYLYENFQAPAESLAIAPSNSAEYSLFSYDTIPGSHDDDEVVVSPLSTSPGVVFFGNQGFSNNMVTLGPAYNNLATLPLGRGNYEGIKNYDPSAYNKDNFTADPYDIMITNHAMQTVGDVIFVNNLYDRVTWDIEFQSPKEGVVIYGNFGIDNDGFRVNPRVNNFTLDAEGRRWYEDNCNYFYVDGVIEGAGTCKNVVFGSSTADYPATNPVNLYCGGIMLNNVNYEVVVNGDVYMYDPDIVSIWSNNIDSPLNAWTGMEITKTSGSAANTVGGNIISNNKRLTLGGGNKAFTIPGDVIMTNPAGTLELKDDVRVTGKVISAGRVIGDGVAHNTVVQGADAYASYSRPDYGTDYISAQSGGDYDYRLMPFEHRIDEIFERYYRWDLKSTNVDDMTTAINNDQQIRESISAGHEWTYDSFDAPEYGGTVYVPCTTPKLENRFVIKKHRYVNPSDAIGKLVENNMTNYVHYTDFVGEEGLPAFNGTEKVPVKVVSHDHAGTIQTDTLPQDMYIVKSSCEIDISEYKNSSFFIDPSDLTGNNIIKIGLKGSGDYTAVADRFMFIVNNTADYGDDYTDPTPYCEEDPIRCANRIQVQVFWDSSFAPGGENPWSPGNHYNVNPYFMTTGAWHQMNEETELSVVQNPDFPTEDDNLNGLDPSLRYAYELIPNFTMFGEAGVNYRMVGNAAKFNADVAMPLSGITFGTVNSGTYTVTYRERSSSQPSTGQSYLWSISSIMLDNLTYNDDYAMTAYVGGVGYSGGNTPDIETTERSGGNSSAKIGDNKNSWFKKDYISD